ncbi:MAG: response regulator [Thiomargarita sp.]|nr:response regulator [Thiomargarita sp.]
MSKNATILFVDDEERILRSLKVLFKSSYNVHITTNGNDALDIIKQNTVHVIVSDQRMPEMLGVDLLHQVKEYSPNTVRLLLTGYSELGAIVSSVNKGEIFRYIKKPWDNDNIQSVVHQAVRIGGELFNATPPSVPVSHSEKQKMGILVIDDDIEIYRMVKEIAEPQYRVTQGLTMESAINSITHQNDIAVLISELSLAGEDMSLALKMIKQHAPNLVILVLSKVQDADSLISLVNEGKIFRFLLKPVRKELLERSLNSSIQHYLSTQENPALLACEIVEKTQKGINSGLFKRITNLFS